MIHAFKRRGETTRQASGFLLSSRNRKVFYLAAWLFVPALLTLAVGCGGGSAKKAKEATAAAEAQPAQEEEKEAPAEAAPAPAKKKQRFVMIPAAKTETPPPAAPSTNDITKWKAADLDAAFARKDLMFALAVVFYSGAKRDDAKRAEELDQLVHKVALMKDDSTIPVPFPPGAFTAADQQSATSTTQPAAAATEDPAAKGPRFKFGKNRKKDKGNE